MSNFSDDFPRNLPISKEEVLRILYEDYEDDYKCPYEIVEGPDVTYDGDYATFTAIAKKVVGEESRFYEIWMMFHYIVGQEKWPTDNYGAHMVMCVAHTVYKWEPVKE